MAIVGNRKRELKASDYYATPRWLCRAIYEDFHHYVSEGRIIVDPAAGDGRLLEPWSRRFDVRGFDIEPRGEGIKERDFLDAVSLREEWGDLWHRVVYLCNPPFSLGESWLRQLVNLGAPFIMIQNVLFDTSAGRAGEHSSTEGWRIRDLDLCERTAVAVRPKFELPDGTMHETGLPIAIWSCRLPRVPKSIYRTKEWRRDYE